MNRKKLLIAFLHALFITVLWTSFTKYEYIGSNYYILNRINLFPLVLWTIGLTTLYSLHTSIKTKYPLFHITVFYLVALGLLEAFGYYVLNIRLNSNYPSLFNLGIIHAPVYMKMFYVIAGPVYIILTDILIKKNKRIFHNTN